MSKKVLIISTSPRKNGNSEALSDAFMNGAKDGGNAVEKISLYDKTIYYYEMSGQMKTMLDRANPLYPTDYAFRDIYFLSTAAEDEEDVDGRAISGLEGWIECFPKAHLTGTVFAGGVGGVGEIDGHSALTKAYEMGRAI